MQRRFLLKSSAATAAMTLSAGSLSAFKAGRFVEPSRGPGNKWPGRVVINFNKNAIAGLGASEPVTKKMVDYSIKLLTGETSVGAAWKAVFPSTLTADSKIAIKINIMNYGLTCSNPIVVRAICDGLLQMDFDGTALPAKNITVYDTHYFSSDSAGFTLERFGDVNMIKDTRGVFDDGVRGMEYAKAAHEADFLINIPSLRGHEAWVGKVTLGFKSHFGTYLPYPHDNNPDFNPEGDDVHRYLRDINCTGVVHKKTVLTVCSALYGQYELNGPHGGPQNYSRYVKTIDSTASTVYPSTILMSTDPVSLEMQSIKIMRLTQNPAGEYTTESMPAYLRASAGIEGALPDAVYDIGVIDEAAMEILRIVNDETIVPVRRPLPAPVTAGSGIAASHIRGTSSSFIEFRLPSSHTGQQARIQIHDAAGSLVRVITRKVTGVANQVSWDERTDAGRLAPAGTYVVRLLSGLKRCSSRLTIAR